MIELKFEDRKSLNEFATKVTENLKASGARVSFGRVRSAISASINDKDGKPYNDNSIKAALDAGEESLATTPAKPFVRGFIRSDDGLYTAEVNCVAYLKKITMEEFKKLWDCGFSGDYPTDEVAYFFRKRRDVDLILSHAENVTSQGGTMGFECTINRQQALEWALEHSPEFLTQLDVPDFAFHITAMDDTTVNQTYRRRSGVIYTEQTPHLDGKPVNAKYVMLPKMTNVIGQKPAFCMANNPQLVNSYINEVMICGHDERKFVEEIHKLYNP